MTLRATYRGTSRPWAHRNSDAAPCDRCGIPIARRNGRTGQCRDCYDLARCESKDLEA